VDSVTTFLMQGCATVVGRSYDDAID